MEATNFAEVDATVLLVARRTVAVTFPVIASLIAPEGAPLPVL